MQTLNRSESKLSDEVAARMAEALGGDLQVRELDLLDNRAARLADAVSRLTSLIAHFTSPTP